jgi:uncharacterized protein (DUF427 family)
MSNAPQPPSASDSKTRGRVRTEPSEKRVRAFLQGRLVADTLQPLLVWEIPYYPAYYLPRADVRAELVATGETVRSPSRGGGQVHDVVLDGATAPGAAVVYPDSPIEALRDHVKLEWDAMSSWFEEDDEVFTHPRSPYARIDVLPSSRHVVVRAGEGPDATVVADSVRAHVLHETGLPPRWYIPQVDVRMELMSPSDTVTHCPYKGRASHLHANLADGTTIADAAWTYPYPLRESLQIAGLVSFYPDKSTIDVSTD